MPATPIGRLGGAAIALAFTVIAAAIWLRVPMPKGGAEVLQVIVLTSLAMFALGFWDDHRPLGARLKFGAQCLVAATAFAGGIRIEVLKNPFTDVDVSLGLFGFFATVFWLVALPNLINLIDGIDGLAGGVCLMLMCLLANLGTGGDSAYLMLLPVGVAGSLLGFLRYNFPPARIHMGDGGAYFLGFLIGTLSIVNSNKGTIMAALVAPAFALALPIIDVGLAVLRRSLRGLPIFRPDRKHIHHYLLTHGFSRRRAVLALYTFSSICLGLAFGVFWWQGRWLPLFCGLLFLVVLVSGHGSGLTRNWAALGSQVGQSLAWRRETRYALALGRWLQMEAERQVSMPQLWQDFEFMVQRLGFQRARLLRRVPDTASSAAGPGLLPRQCFQMTMHDELTLELVGSPGVMSDELFKLLADLAAETWHKAAMRWRVLHPAQPAGPPASLPRKSSAPRVFACTPAGVEP